MQMLESAQFRIKHNPDDDEFELANYEENTTGGSQDRTVVISSKGQEARNDLYNTIKNKKVPI